MSTFVANLAVNGINFIAISCESIGLLALFEIPETLMLFNGLKAWNFNVGVYIKS